MIFISILTLIVAKALPVLNTNISSVHFFRSTSLVFIITGFITLNSLYLETIGTGIGIYSGLFHVTQITQFIETFFYLIVGLVLIGWPQIITKVNKVKYYLTDKYSTDYSLIILFSSLGSSLLIGSSDLISLYLSIELQSFGLYVLATLYRNSESSTNLGLILIFIGFLFKIAAAPLHNWSPDVYDGTPTIVTMYLTILPKIAIFTFLLEISTQLGIKLILNSYGETYNSFLVESSIYKLFLITSICSLIIGSVLGLAQVKIKRLLAYSTISHIGFILLALLINTEQSIDSFLFYILQYTITNLNLFLIILALTYTHNINSYQELNLKNKSLLINKPLPLFLPLGLEKGKSSFAEIISYKYKDLSYILQLKNLFFTNPLLSLCLCICLFSMAGIPPLIGFFSKQFVLYAALQNGFYLTSILAIIVSVISASYYLKIVKLLISANENETNTESESTELLGLGLEKENKEVIVLTNVHSFIISTLTLILLLFFIKPSLILNSTQLLSLSLFYT